MVLISNAEIIKILRKAKRMTQKELVSDGYCSVRELQRIESFMVKPTKKIFAHLLLNMGEAATEYSYDSVNEDDKTAYAIITKIEDLIYNLKYHEAKERFDELMLLEIFNLKNRFNLQIKLRLEMIFLSHLDNNKEHALQKGYEALRVIVSDFDVKELKMHWLIEQNYHILNTLATLHINLGEAEIGIDILMQLYKLLNEEKHSKELKPRLLPLICYNLSKYLGLRGRHEEALVVCIDGINVWLPLSYRKAVVEGI